jgi:hypothetical protein
MSRLLILVATDPPLVRETIAVALHEVRPGVDTIAVEPAALTADIARYQPDVTICSLLSVAVESRVPSWVLLSSEGSNAAVTSVLGIRQETAHLSFADLVALVDRAARAVS